MKVVVQPGVQPLPRKRVKGSTADGSCKQKTFGSEEVLSRDAELMRLPKRRPRHAFARQHPVDALALCRFNAWRCAASHLCRVVSGHLEYV